MDGYRVLEAIESAKGSKIATKQCRAGDGRRPAIMKLDFEDGSSISFNRLDAVNVQTEEQLAAFVARVTG